MLVVALLFIATSPASAAVLPGVSPNYVNTEEASTRITIDNAGNVEVVVNCMAKPGTTKIYVSSYVEKQYGTTWVRVDNGQAGYAWQTTVNYFVLADIYTFKLPSNSAGTYRVVSTFLVTASTTETIVLMDQYTF